MILCSKCKQTIGEEDFNVSTDYAFCRKCGTVHRFSDLAEAAGDSGVDLDAPPRGVRIYDNGSYELLCLRHYSAAAWFFAVFAIFWSSITVTVSSAFFLKEGLWHWHTLFFIPFYLIGVGMSITALFCFFGRSEIRFPGDSLETFSGVGAAGFRRTFETKAVRKVEVRTTGTTQNGSPWYGVYLHFGNESKKLCSGPDRDKMEFIAAYLRRRLKQGK